MRACRRRALLTGFAAAACVALQAMAGLDVMDTGEEALNGTFPDNNSGVTRGGWSYSHASVGPNSGTYSASAGLDSPMGIRLAGLGTYITSPEFKMSAGTAMATARISESSGGIPDDGAACWMALTSGNYYLRISTKTTKFDWNFYYQINGPDGFREGVIPRVTCNNTYWWAYAIELDPNGYAMFTVENGITEGNIRIAHGITGDFTNYQVGISRSGSIFDYAQADFDNLLVISTCVVEKLLTTSDKSADGDLTQIRAFRDGVLSKSASGSTLTRLYYHFSPELCRIMAAEPALALRARGILEAILPALVTSGENGGTVVLPRSAVAAACPLLGDLEPSATPPLAAGLRIARRMAQKLLRDSRGQADVVIDLTR